MSELHHLIGYRPHAGQQAFHESPARFKVLIAGARFGKSLAAARDVVPDLVSGRSRGWLVGPLFALTRPEHRVLRDDLLRVLRTTPVSRATGRTMDTRWGAQTACQTAYLPETLLGEEVDWMILCEAAHLARDDYERYLRARLATRSGRLLVPTTPRGRNWVHELYERGLEGGDWQSFKYATWDNPRVPPGEISEARATLPDETFAEQFGGEFSAAAGRVYREFVRELHVAAGLQAGPGMVIYKAVDFGYTHPFVCLWGFEDGDGRLLVLREYVMAGESLSVHAAAIHAVEHDLEAAGAVIGPGWADPAGALEIKTLANEGIRLQKANNKLLGGIEVVRRRMLKRGDGAAGLVVDASCTNLLRELENYEWGESTRAGPPIPRKVNDHALDALRYLCVGLERRVSWRQ